MDALQRVRPFTTLPPSDLIALNPRPAQQAARSLHPAGEEDRSKQSSCSDKPVSLGGYPPENF